MDVRVGLWRKLSAEELMLLNCGVGKDSGSPLDCKEIQPVHPKGNQSWIFIRRTDAEAPLLWPSDVKNWLIGKDPGAGKDGRQEEKGMTKDEMVGWHHWLNGHEFEQALGDSDGQGSLASCSPWGIKESDWATELNWSFHQAQYFVPTSIYFLLCMGFIHLVSVSFLRGSMRVTLCPFFLSVPTTLGLGRHILSALSKRVCLSFCTLHASFISWDLWSWWYQAYN